MAVDTPARIAILGAGPIGLEAALYARFLGYEVVIYERGRVSEHVQQWRHVRMFSPFAMNRSPLAIAALTAQDETYQPPADDALLTGAEFFERYLRALAECDLLSDSLRLGQQVVSVGRENFLKGELPGREERGEFDFRLLVRDSEGREFIENADVMIDTTGVFGQPNWFGGGGVPAPGERALRAEVDYHLPDVLGAQRERFAGRHVLLIGAGLSAATNVVALAQLAREAPSMRVTWITRRGAAPSQPGPLPLIENDRLPARAALARAANEACEAGTAVTYWPNTDVEAVHREGEAFVVELSGEHNGSFAFDRIIANVGYRPDDRLYEELQVHTCYASGGPMKLAAKLSGASSGDCLDQVAHGPQSLLNPEPNFYVLGAKSYGRNSSFLLSVGLRQIVEVFSIIGDRETLDLYANARLPP
jgi:thioredoxin reductase